MKVVNEVSWMIGGPQGTGVDSSATLFANACATSGLWIFGKREYHSNIKGKHSYFQVRVSNEPIHSHVDEVHILATFEDSTAKLHAHEVVKGGAIIYDPTKIKLDDLNLKSGVITLPIDFNLVLRHVAEETGAEYAKLSIMKNTIAVAASFALLRMDIKWLEKTFEKMYQGKKSKFIGMNVAGAKKAYDAVAALPKELHDQFPYHLEPMPNTPPRLLINGAQATAMGKLKAGCRFHTYYPISPATDESAFLESHPEFGIAVVQVEDEIAAINMALGGATTGVRSSTSTSGPGYCLMTEGLGWAGMNEVPVVVFNYQRGGPSTGLPTRHEQGDLMFAIFGGHGEYPRIVMAPGSIADHFAAAFESFNYADKFQTPVTVLNDKFLANSTQTLTALRETGLVIDRGRLATDEELKNAVSENRGFPRFRPDKQGTSPRAFPGQEGSPYWMTGDEHDDYGHITELPETRMKMHEKRMNKYRLMLEQIPQENQFSFHGEPDADVTIICWGSTLGILLDAMPVLKKRGIKVNFIHIRILCPFPAAGILPYLKKAKKLIGIESTYSGVISQLVQMHTGINVPSQVVKYTGRPMSLNEVADSVEKIANGQIKPEPSFPAGNQQVERVVLSYGL